MNTTAIAAQALLTCAIAAGTTAAYNRFILAPSMRFGVVDVSEVYRLKEKQILEVVTKPNVTDNDRQKAIAMTMEFTKLLPTALEQLSNECRCFVLVRSAVAAETPNTVDLTPLLRQKIGV